MRKTKRFFALIIVMLMMISIFAGCGNQKRDVDSNGQTIAEGVMNRKTIPRRRISKRVQKLQKDLIRQGFLL